MAHFSPVNGAFPHKNQIDRTCPVKPLGATATLADYAKTYQRGRILFVNTAGQFESANSATAKGPLYFCLQDYGDTQAAMAGGPLGTGKGATDGRNVPFGGGGTHQDTVTFDTWVQGNPMPNHDAAAYGQPAVTGLSFQESGNYETDAFKKGETYSIGAPLKVADGEFVPAANENEAVAHVYAAPFRRYSNDAVSRDGWSTGAYISVIRVSV